MHQVQIVCMKGQGKRQEGTDREIVSRIFSNRRWHRGGFSDLRRPHAPSGFETRKCPALGLLLPNQRFDHKLRFVFGSRPQRKDNLGKAGCGYAALRHRIRRDHCRAAHFRLRARVVVAADDWRGRRVLVTGGAGFIGSALIWALNQRQCETIVVADFPASAAKRRNLAPLRFQDYVSPDVLLAGASSGWLREFDVVLHMGACSSTTETDTAYLRRNNYQFFFTYFPSIENPV